MEQVLPTRSADLAILPAGTELNCLEYRSVVLYVLPNQHDFQSSTSAVWNWTMTDVTAFAFSSSS